jgi:3-oxoacyl-[acyl-carrier protein] reductase
VRYHSEVSKLVETVIEKFKRIDVLVNNAGVAIEKPLVETSDTEWDLVLDTNLKGVFYCCKEVLPWMISRRSGSIINISSGAGKQGFSQLSAYCASKFGIIGLTESMAAELLSYGINVISICPGAVATQMQKKFMSDEEFERMKSTMIQPEKVAKKVLQAIHGKFRSGSAVDVF